MTETRIHWKMLSRLIVFNHNMSFLVTNTLSHFLKIIMQKQKKRPEAAATRNALPLGPSGDSFDEVLDFITTSALPGCADPSDLSSEYRRPEYDNTS